MTRFIMFAIAGIIVLTFVQHWHDNTLYEKEQVYRDSLIEKQLRDTLLFNCPCNEVDTINFIIEHSQLK